MGEHSLYFFIQTKGKKIILYSCSLQNYVKQDLKETTLSISVFIHKLFIQNPSFETKREIKDTWTIVYKPQNDRTGFRFFSTDSDQFAHLKQFWIYSNYFLHCNMLTCVGFLVVIYTQRLAMFSLLNYPDN